MCGRYNIIDDAATRALLESLGIPLALNTRVNIAPTESVPVIIPGADVPEVHEMRWWLTPSWAPEVSTKFSMFNARAESLETSKAFKGPYRHHRGIIPASSFIEWTKNEEGVKQPYLVRPESGCFAFAGLWDTWQKAGSYLESCTVVTTAAISSIQWLHHRMPVLLEPEDFQVWLDPQTDKDTLNQIVNKPPRLAMEVFPLSPQVGNSRLKSIELIEPTDEPIQIKH